MFRIYTRSNTYVMLNGKVIALTNQQYSPTTEHYFVSGIVEVMQIINYLIKEKKDYFTIQRRDAETFKTRKGK